MKYLLLIFFSTLTAFIIHVNAPDDSFLFSPISLLLVCVLVLVIFLMRYHQISRQQMPGEFVLKQINKNIQKELAYILLLPFLLLQTFLRNIHSFNGFSLFIIPLTFLCYEVILKWYYKKFQPNAYSINHEFIYCLSSCGIKKYPLHLLVKIGYNKIYRAVDFCFEEGLHNFKMVFNDYAIPDLLRFYNKLKHFSPSTLFVEEKLELYMQVLREKESCENTNLGNT